MFRFVLAIFFLIADLSFHGTQVIVMEKNERWENHKKTSSL
jgi:hypothetical protein